MKKSMILFVMVLFCSTSVFSMNKNFIKKEFKFEVRLQDYIERIEDEKEERKNREKRHWDGLSRKAKKEIRQRRKRKRKKREKKIERRRRRRRGGIGNYGSLGRFRYGDSLEDNDSSDPKINLDVNGCSFLDEFDDNVIKKKKKKIKKKIEKKEEFSVYDLFAAVDESNSGLAKSLIKKVDIHEEDGLYGKSALVYAVYFLEADIVEEMLKSKKLDFSKEDYLWFNLFDNDPNRFSKNDIWRKKKQARIYNLLIKAGYRYDGEQTALAVASAYGWLESVKFLLNDLKVDPKEKCADGSTAMYWAMHSLENYSCRDDEDVYSKVINLLEKHGVKFQAPTTEAPVSSFSESVNVNEKGISSGLDFKDRLILQSLFGPQP